MHDFGIQIVFLIFSRRYYHQCKCKHRLKTTSIVSMSFSSCSISFMHLEFVCRDSKTGKKKHIYYSCSDNTINRYNDLLCIFSAVFYCFISCCHSVLNWHFIKINQEKSIERSKNSKKKMLASISICFTTGLLPMINVQWFLHLFSTSCKSLTVKLKTKKK